MKLRGHWFCWHCEEIAFMPMPDCMTILPAYCPNCHNHTLNFVTHEPPQKPVARIVNPSPERAASLFKQMYQITKL